MAVYLLFGIYHFYLVFDIICFCYFIVQCYIIFLCIEIIDKYNTCLTFFSLTNDPTLVASFLKNILQVRPVRVREKIITFIETFEDLLSSSDDEIDAFVTGEVHNDNGARASNAKLLIGSNVVLGLKSILFELKNRDVCDALPSVAVLNFLDPSQVSSMRKVRRQALIN